MSKYGNHVMLSIKHPTLLGMKCGGCRQVQSIDHWDVCGSSVDIDDELFVGSEPDPPLVYCPNCSHEQTAKWREYKKFVDPIQG